MKPVRLRTTSEGRSRAKTRCHRQADTPLALLLTLLCVAFALGSPLAQAATRTVTKVADTNDGVCNADCSLREAISVAAPGDEIVFATPLFSSARTIVLAEANGFRELVISKSLTIRGPGADLLTLQPAPQVSQPPFRIFNFTGAGVDVTLQGMTITGGRTFVGNGGGINVTGGAVLLVSQCHVTGNLARAGGGLYASSDSSLTVLNSTVSGNSDLGFDGSGGGGIHNEGNLFISGSTISGNVTGAGSQAAGGVWSSGTGRISHSTITDNEVAQPATAAVASGVYSGPGSMTIRSSIVAANRGSRTKPDVYGEFVTSGFNLIGNVGQATGFSHPSDRVGTATSLLNPRLDPLANYGGRTPTHRPQPMSPAIDHGNSFSVRIDQRGSARVIDQIAFPSPGGSDAADVGSYEAGHYLVVTKIEDTKDGTCDSDCSLREAIEAATPGSAIVFAEPLFASPRTIFLNTSEGFRDLFINKGLTIAGRGAHLLTIQRIDGTDSHRLFNISGAGVQVDIHGVTLHHGRAIGSGGALNVNEGAAVKLSHCTISGSSAFRGGGLFIAPDSRMTLLHSTVAGNHASNLFTGGGIHNEGILTVVNSTISGNSTDGLAGGIWSTGTATISSSTVTDNGANPETGAAGGIARASGTVTIVNSIVAANRNNQTRPDLSGGNFASQGFNLIGNIGSATGFNQAGDQSGTATSPLDPMLDALAFSGGSMRVHRLQPGSPALDRGNSGGLAFDQGERPRPKDLPLANGPGDGADIGAWEAQVVPSAGIIRAESRKAQGGSGTFDLLLPVEGTPAVECRAAGPGGSHQIVVTFLHAVEADGLVVTSIDGMASGTMSISGGIITVDLTGVANAQTIQIRLLNVNENLSLRDVVIRMGVLAGDVTGNGAVTASDIAAVKSQSGQPVTAENFRADVTANGGAVNASDIGLVKSRSGTQLP